MGDKSDDRKDSGVQSMTYKQICNRMDDIRDELDRLNTRAEQNGNLTDDDEKRWAERTSEFDELQTRKRGLERQADLLRVKQTDVGKAARDVLNPRTKTRLESGADDFDYDPLGEPDSIQEHRFRDPWDVSEVRMGLDREARGHEFRARAYAAIEKMQGATQKRRETATKIIEEFDTVDAKISQQLLATSNADYLRAFGKLARSQGQVALLSPKEQEAVNRAMSLTDGSGGFLVPFQLDPTLILASDGVYNDVRAISRKVVATGDVWHGVSGTNVAWSFDAEAAEVSDDTPTFAQPTVTVRTARGFVPISIEAYQDEANVAAEVGRLLAAGKDDLEATKFISGVAASNEPVGLLAATGGLAGIAGAKVASATADTIAIDDLFVVQGSLATRYRRRASWLANNWFYQRIRALDTSVYENLAAGLAPTLLGRPIYEADAMDAALNAGADNYFAVFGDFDFYVIADRIGTTVEFIPHLFGATHLPTGQRGWFAFYRVGASLVDPTGGQGFKVYNVT